MITLTIIIFVSLLIRVLILRLALVVSEKSLKEREKITPFECGFSPFKKARIPFSLRFFIITLIFIIFDIEVAIVLPLGVIINSSTFNIIITAAVIVVVILTAGLLHE